MLHDLMPYLIIDYARIPAAGRDGMPVAIGNNWKRQGTMREVPAVSGGGNHTGRPFAGADHPERVPGERVGFSVDFRRSRRPDPVSPSLGRTPRVWKTEMVALENLERHIGDPGTVLFLGGTLAGKSVTCRKPAVLHSSGVHGTSAPVFRLPPSRGERIVGVAFVRRLDHRTPPAISPTSSVPARSSRRGPRSHPPFHHRIPSVSSVAPRGASSRAGVHSNGSGVSASSNRDRSMAA